MEEQLKTVYIKFLAPVEGNTCNIFMNIVDQKIKEGVKRIVILISTPGGSVFHGITMYNFLKGLPIEIDTHNFGSVDSIGTILYCAGKNRYSSSNARFLLHPVTLTIGQGATFGRQKLSELLESLKIDETNIANIIAIETGKRNRTVIKDIDAGTTLLPNAAKEYGLVTEIRTEMITDGAEIISINMS